MGGGKQTMTRIRFWFGCFVLAAGLAVPASVLAQAPASVSALCKDGTTFTGTSRRGACHGHGGVHTWTTAAAAPSATTAPAATTTAAPPATYRSTAPAGATPSAPVTQHAANPMPGQVWVNTATKVYHCPGDRYYGHTKQGEYVSEAAAQAEGARPSRGKSCS